MSFHILPIHHAPDAAVQLADALAVKGDVFAVRNLETEAIAHFDEALALTEAARAAEPQKPERALRVVRALARCSRQHEEMGLWADSLAEAQRMLREAEVIRDPAARREEAAAHRLAAFALSWLERLAECRAEYLVAQKILSTLAAAQPDNAGIASDLAGLDMSLGNLAQKQFNFPLMLKHYQAWHDWAKKAKGTESPYFAHTATRLGHAFVFNRRPAEALSVLGDAVRIATRECEARPGNKDTLNLLYYALRGTAEARVMIGQDAEAKITWAKVAKVQAAQAAPAKPAPVLPSGQELAKCLATEAELFTALLAKPEDQAAQQAWAAASEKLGKAVEAVHGLPAAAEHGARQLAKLHETAMATMTALPPDEALRLAAATRAFLTAPSEDRMTSTEMANQAALERAVAKLKK